MSKSRLFLPLSLLILLTLQAQTPAPADGVIEGVVVEAGTNTPVPSARVEISQDVATIGTLATDASGKFVAKGLQPGRYFAMVERQGFSTGTVITLIEAGQPAVSVRVELKRPGAITGRLLDENRQPRSGMDVQAVRSFFSDGRKVLQTEGSAQTDDRGEYRISGLESAAYHLIARRGETLERTPSRPTFYPGVVDMDAAAKISVVPGSEVRAADFSLLGSSAFRVSIRIVPPAGWASESAQELEFPPFLWVARGRPVPQRWEFGRFVRAAGTSSFTSLPYPPGTYDLYIRLDDHTKPQTPENIYRYSACGHLSVTLIDKDIDLGVFKMQTGIPIRGRITFKGDRSSAFDSSKIRIYPVSDNRCYFQRSVPVAADGSFTIPNVPRSKVHFRFEGLPSGYYVDSARYASREVLDTGMPLENENGGPLEITVMDSGGTVDGTARNAKDEPMANVIVVLVPPKERREQSSNFLRARTDKSGAFRFVGIRPGEYRLLVWEGTAPNPEDPAVLKDFENRGMRITVQRGYSSSAGNIRTLQSLP